MTQKQIIQDIELDTGLKLVAQAFTEIASIKLQKIRARIERNRSFFEEISNLFGAVQKLAQSKGIVPKLRKTGTAAVILTSNSKFYGGLERRLMLFFTNTLSNLPAEAGKPGIQQIIIGRSGADFFRTSARFAREARQAITLNQDLPNEAELKNLTELIKRFDHVLVFYPRFQSVLLQKPFIVDLTESGIASTNKQPTLDYILEPEIGTMWQFFEAQILKLLLEQTFLDAELARTAARLISMDQAQDNADKAINDSKIAMAGVKRSLNNNRILEIESAMFRFRRRPS